MANCTNVEMWLCALECFGEGASRGRESCGGAGGTSCLRRELGQSEHCDGKMTRSVAVTVGKRRGSAKTLIPLKHDVKWTPTVQPKLSAPSLRLLCRFAELYWSGATTLQNLTLRKTAPNHRIVQHVCTWRALTGRSPGDGFEVDWDSHLATSPHNFALQDVIPPPTTLSSPSTPPSSFVLLSTTSHEHRLRRCPAGIFTRY